MFIYENLMFDDMIADTETNNKIKSYGQWVNFKRKKTHYFTCFYITILFQSA